MNGTMNPVELDVPGLVKLIRKQLALSQEALARQLGISFVTLHRWEKGHSKPSPLGRAQLSIFCDGKVASGQLRLEDPKWRPGSQG